MILTAHQPAYLPWLGFFHKVALSDTLCVLDVSRYDRSDFINRNRIKTAAGTRWLTVPVHSHGAAGERICDVRISGSAWQKKHLLSMRHAYAKAPYFDDYRAEIETLLSKRYTFLTDLTSAALRLFLDLLGIDVSVVMASDYDFAGKKTAYVLDMCRQLGATTFLFGSRGRDYARAESFHEAGIEAVFQEYCHPVYRQRYGAFVPSLSVVDLLYNEGPGSLEVILRGNVRTLGTRQIGAGQPQEDHPLTADLRVEHQ